MESPSDTDSDGSFLNSQPASPISLSPDASTHFDHEILQRRLVISDVAVSPEERYSGVRKFKTIETEHFDVEESFKYDWIFLGAFLPTLCLTLGFIDESFLLIFGAGAGISKLLLDAGYEKRALAAAFITFILFQCALLLSTLPLLWTSISYFFLLFLLNSFAVLSAAWIFLHFSVFRSIDVEFTVILEKILFGTYPLVNLALQSWMFVSFAKTTSYLPYFLLVVGFIYAQTFLSIRPSSFWRRRKLDDSAEAPSSLPPLVLPAEVVLFASAIYAFIPAAAFLVVHLPEAFFMDWSFYLRFCFLLSVGIFLASLFFGVNDVASYLTFLDLTPRQIRTVKLISGGNSLLCGYLWTVNALSSTSSGTWLPWLPLFACVHVGIGVAASQNVDQHRRAAKLALVAAGVFCFAYAAFFFQFPLLRRARGLVFHFGFIRLSIFAFVLLLFLLSVASAAIVVLPLFSSRYRLHPCVNTIVIVTHAVLFHFAEMLLFLYDVYPFAGVLLSAAFFSLLYFRMYRVQSRPTIWTTLAVWLGVSLALAKVYYALSVQWDYRPPEGESFLNFLVVFLLIAISSGLALFVVKIKFNPTKSQPFSDFDERLLLPPALLLQCAAHFVFVRPLWTKFFDVQSMTFGDSSSVHMVLTGVLVKSLLGSEVLSAITPAFYAFWFSLSTAVFLLQPSLAFSTENLRVCLQLVGISFSAHLLFLGRPVESGPLRPKTWILYSYGMGIPLAIKICPIMDIQMGINIRTLLYTLTILIATGIVLGHLWPMLHASEDEGEIKGSDGHRRFFYDSIAPRMQISLMAVILISVLFELSSLSPVSRQWNDVSIFRPNAPPIIKLISILFPLLSVVSRIDDSYDLTKSSPLFRPHLIRSNGNAISEFLSNAFHFSTLSNVLVLISFLVFSSCVSWGTLHPTTRHLLFALTSLHLALLRPDPVVFSPSNSLGLKTDHASFFVVAALLLYCGVLQIFAISASRFWRSEGGLMESVLNLLEIVICVTLVPCVTLTAAQVSGDALFPVTLLTTQPPAAFSFATLPSAILLFFISTSSAARIVSLLQFAFSAILLSLHLVRE